MIASIVACGASLDGMAAILGAKAVVRRFDIRRGCQVTVMESGKFLGVSTDAVIQSPVHVLVFDDEDVIFAANAQLHSTADQFLLASLAQSICVSCITRYISCHAGR